MGRFTELMCKPRDEELDCYILANARKAKKRLLKFMQQYPYNSYFRENVTYAAWFLDEIGSDEEDVIKENLVLFGYA